MKLKKVFLLSGPPGCGKSTFAEKCNVEGAAWISRDKIRFNLLQPGDDYFSCETEVFERFIQAINDALTDENIAEIYIDATHLNQRSREKTTRRLHKTNIEELNAIYFSTPRSVCQERNSLREGRAKVPTTIVNNMFNSYTYPTRKEGFCHIYKIDENGIMKEVYWSE